MRNLKKALIGAQLVRVADNGFVVIKDNVEYMFEFDTDQGDCCGYADITGALRIDGEDLSNNPIITDITYDIDERDSHMVCFITLFGDSKLLYEINAEAGSGSGWCYGAVAKIQCKLLDIDEVVASW